MEKIIKNYFAKGSIDICQLIINCSWSWHKGFWDWTFISFPLFVYLKLKSDILESHFHEQLLSYIAFMKRNLKNLINVYNYNFKLFKIYYFVKFSISPIQLQIEDWGRSYFECWIWIASDISYQFVFFCQFWMCHILISYLRLQLIM